jgi:PPOX class probable F420-dependent enzyme
MRSIEGEQVLLRLILSESRTHDRRPLFRKIVDVLRAEGIAGTTVLKGVAGFGHDRDLHTIDLEVAAQGLPVVIEVVDTAEQINRIRPRLEALMEGGVMMTERARVLRYTADDTIADDPSSALAETSTAPGHPGPDREEVVMPLSPDVRTLLDEPNFVHLATLMPDGSPQSAPVWVGLDGDRILVATGEGSLKAKNTRRDPRVSLSVVAMDNPYREAQLRGRVVERRLDRDLAIMDRISQKYTGAPFPMRGKPEERVVLVIEIERERYAVLPFRHTPPKRG